MNTIKTTILALAFAGVSQAQEGGRPEGPEGPREGSRGGMMRMSPLMVALDADKNGELSEEEIKNASVALKSLDKNGDGKLSAEEMRPAGGRGGEFGGPRGGGNPEEMVARMMESDKNKDGKLTKDELPERMAAMLERGDTDKDGALSKEEIKKMAEQRQPGQGGGRGGERPTQR